MSEEQTNGNFSSQLYSLLSEAQRNLENRDRLDNLNKRIDGADLRRQTLLNTSKDDGIINIAR